MSGELSPTIPHRTSFLHAGQGPARSRAFLNIPLSVAQSANATNGRTPTSAPFAPAEGQFRIMFGSRLVPHLQRQPGLRYQRESSRHERSCAHLSPFGSGLGQGNVQTQDHTARTHRKRSCSRVCTGREVALQRIRHVYHADLLAATDQRCTGDSTIRVRTALASLPILADCAE